MIMKSQVEVLDLNEEGYLVIIRFISQFGNLIGLSLRIKLKWSLSFKSKLDTYISEGNHSKKEDFDRQITTKNSGSCNEDPHNVTKIKEQVSPSS